MPSDGRASPVVGWSLALAAFAHVAYLALLITCDALRVVPFGFVPHFDGHLVTVEQVQPATLAARAGLRPHDRLRRANGQVLEGRVDWQRMRVQLDPSRPLELDIERDGRPLTLRLPLSAGLGEVASRSEARRDRD